MGVEAVGASTVVTAPLENTGAKGAVEAVGASTVVTPLKSVGASLAVLGPVVVGGTGAPGVADVGVEEGSRCSALSIVTLIFSLAGIMEKVAKKS